MKTRIYKYVICLSCFCAFFSCKSEAQNSPETIEHEETSLDSAEFSYTMTHENHDENYTLEIGVKNETISVPGTHTIDLSHANKVSLMCSSAKDSSANLPSPEGITFVSYKNKDITENVRKMMSSFNEGFTLSRSPEFEKIEHPITVTLEKGYVLFVHREILISVTETK
jgi:hypothetical protein